MYRENTCQQMQIRYSRAMKLSMWASKPQAVLNIPAKDQQAAFGYATDFLTAPSLEGFVGIHSRLKEANDA